MDCLHRSQIFHAAAKPRTSVIESQSHRLYGYGNAVIGGDIAQMVERVLCMHKVRGSIPCVSIFCFLRLYAHYVSPHLFLFPRVRLVPARQCERRRDPRAARDGGRSEVAVRASREPRGGLRARATQPCVPAFLFPLPTRSPRRRFPTFVSPLSPPRLASQCSSWRRCAPRTASGRDSRARGGRSGARPTRSGR